MPNPTSSEEYRPGDPVLAGEQWGSLFNGGGPPSRQQAVVAGIGYALRWRERADVSPPWLKSPMLQRRHPFSEQLHWCDLQGSRNTYSLTSRVILDESLQAVASHQVFISVQFNHQKPFWPQAVCQWLSGVGFFVTPWTVALQAPLYMRFSR